MKRARPPVIATQDIRAFAGDLLPTVFALENRSGPEPDNAALVAFALVGVVEKLLSASKMEAYRAEMAHFLRTAPLADSAPAGTIAHLPSIDDHVVSRYVETMFESIGKTVVAAAHKRFGGNVDDGVIILALLYTALASLSVRFGIDIARRAVLDRIDHDGEPVR